MNNKLYDEEYESAPLREVLAQDFYDMPYLDAPELSVPEFQKKVNLLAAVNNRIVFLEKIDGILFSITRDGFWLESKAQEEERKLIRSVWMDHNHKLNPELEYLGVVCMYSRKRYYHYLPAFFMLHTIYNMGTQSIIPFHETQILASALKINTVPVLLNLQLDHKMLPELGKIAREISESDSMFSRNNLQGIVIRREGSFMAFSAEHFVAQVKGRFVYNNPIYKSNYIKNSIKC